MPITVDGVSYPDVGAWNRAMDAQAVAAAPSMYPSAAAAPTQTAPTTLAVSPDLLDTSLSPAVAGGSLAKALGPSPTGPAVPNYQNRGDWLDTVVMQRESGGNPNIGWGRTDLTPWINAGQTVYGFPDWPGKPGPAGNSTAAGLYQITKTNWKHYAPLLGINDFSPESQRKVAEAILRDQGPRAWAASGPIPGRVGGRFAAAGPVAGAAPSSDTGSGSPGIQQVAATPADSLAEKLKALQSIESQNLNDKTTGSGQFFQNLLNKGGGATIPLVPGPRGTALQPVPVPPAPNLKTGYEEALAAVLNGRRRGLGSIFG